MTTVHKPVLLNEVLTYLDPKPSQIYVDGTIGGGGHAEAILDKIMPDGKLIGFDLDCEAIARTKERLKKYKKHLILINESYTKIKTVLYDEKIHTVNGAIIDLGISSDLLHSSGRGFSFQTNEPLDMRFAPEQNELTAEEIINDWPVEKIKGILSEYGEERFAGQIAGAIMRVRKDKRILTTLELVQIVQGAVPARFKSKINPATKTFQALRIAVNHELENVSEGIKNIVEALSPGARFAVISFHSLEDRIVKQYFKGEAQGCICPREIPVCRCNHRPSIRLITKKPIMPSEKEIAENFRCRSAKLRVIEKI